jgi:hypothetical protein
MNNKLELEMMFELYNMDYRYEIGPDRDGLDLLEIRYYDSIDSKKAHTRLTFTKDEAKLIVQAINKLVE